MADAGELIVRFWGVRGTLPCPGKATLRYGGNTSCVEVLCGGQRLIFDAGTGLRSLGKALVAVGGPIRTHLFFSHTHFDHINGLPFFKPGYDRGNKIQLWSGHLRQQGRRLQDVLNTIMESPYFPVPLDILHACIGFNDFDPGDALTPLPGVVLRTAALRHPGGAVGYRIEYGGHVACYVTDTEHPAEGHDRQIVELIRDADLVIYDATYTDEEYPTYRGWGHSTWQEGVRLCALAGARRLVAFHHDPEHDDATLDRIAAKLERASPGSLVAREGLEIRL